MSFTTVLAANSRRSAMFIGLVVIVAVGLRSGPAGFGPGTAAGASTFTVNSTGDAGDAVAGDGVCDTVAGPPIICTLRAAIEEANALPGTDIIEFNIPGAGPHTISPASALPTITDPVPIDGTTEPDFAGTPVIELEGSGAGAGVNGLTIAAGSSTVKGLVINSFGRGIRLETLGENTIEGNYIGTDVSGTVDTGNGGDGVLIVNSPNNTVGGTTAAARNIISGNRRGVFIIGSGGGNVVEGNYIGTDVTGTAALGNSTEEEVFIAAPNNTIGGTTAGARNIIVGVVLIAGASATGNVVLGNYIGTDVTGTVDLAIDMTLGARGVRISRGASGNTIGGTTAGARNIISGASGSVDITTGSSNNLVLGNYIGTDVTGTVSVGNSSGVGINAADNNTIGGTTAGARNLISGNRNGVLISNGATGNMVQGNYIGTDVTGTVAVFNLISGVTIRDGAANNTIGGTVNGAGNIIAFNCQGGVRVIGDTSTGNAILSNSIFSNCLQGIDLAPTRPGLGGSGDGVTPNDAGDGDTGGNNLQNFPVLTSVESGSTNIEGSLNSTANTEFRVEFFANTACDPSGNGEGETFLGFDTVTTDGPGNVSFSVSFPTTVTVGKFITATATDPAGNTSEFSECIAVTAAPTPTPTPTATPPSGPPPLGGSGVFPDVPGAGGSSSIGYGVVAGVLAAVTAGAFALGYVAWYRRRIR